MTNLTRWAIVVGVLGTMTGGSLSAQAALVIKADGTSLNCRLSPSQSLVLSDKTNDRVVSLSEVMWLVGQEMRAVGFVGGHGRAIRCRVKPTAIGVQLGHEEIAIPLESIVFLYAGEVPSDAGWVKVVESQYGCVVLVEPRSSSSSQTKALVLTSNWSGGVTLSDAVYPKTIASTADLGLTLTVKSAEDGFADLQGRADSVGLVVEFRASGKDGERQAERIAFPPLSDWRESLPRCPGDARRVTFDVRSLFYDKLPFGETVEFSGRGNLTVYLQGPFEKGTSPIRSQVELANGSVIIRNTVSNVLSLPIEVTASRAAVR